MRNLGLSSLANQPTPFPPKRANNTGIITAANNDPFLNWRIGNLLFQPLPTAGMLASTTSGGASYALPHPTWLLRALLSRRSSTRRPMSAQEKKAISNRVAQAISEGDLDALDDLMAPELAEEFKRDVTEIRRAFPDYAGTNVEQIAEGEKVANRFVFLGTHLGEFEGVSPTGKRIEFIGHSIDRVLEGKIVESWVEVDMLGVMEQRSAVPEPGQS